MRVDMHCVSLGKAMLSQFSRDRVERVVDRHGLSRYTDNTITSRSELFDELETVRDRGYATDDGEKISGLRCVASPVVTGDTVIGAVSITGPYGHMQGQRWNESLPEQVRRSANVIRINAEFSE
jgi:DNA-binding IclR family transcriptional regulator